MNQQKHLKGLVVSGLIAAAYTALSLALAPFSFGYAQVRVSEALTLLPLFSPNAIWGVTLGCAITNGIGAAMGLNFGIVDIVFGTLATLVSALLTARLSKPRVAGLPLLAPLPPVLINAVVVGLELWYFTGAPLLLCMVGVGVGQLVSCYGLGLILVKAMEKTGVDKMLR
ncbi:MAG: QueT transporter family protein [Angelakisella sp.]|nr:QueT transporter family protein [Angelakisella sp.]